MVRELTLWIPGLAGPERSAGTEAAPDFGPAFEGLTLPALARLYARADRIVDRAERPRQDAESALARRFGVTADAAVPLASLALLGETGERRPGYWLRADPVHIQAGIDKAVMRSGDALAVSAVEAAALCAEIAAEMAEEGLKPQALAPSRWYLPWPVAPRVRFASLPAAVGADLYAHMPEGEEALAWRRLLNHVQMVLHASPVNAARRAAGRPEINGLWFWGGGELPSARSVAGADDGVWADDPYVRGLALNAGVPAAGVPEDAAAWLRAAVDGGEGGGRHLLYIDTLREPLRLSDIETWRARVEELHARWFAPLAAALCMRGGMGRGTGGEAGALRRLRICPGGGTAYHISRREMRWRWWRRDLPLHKYKPG